MIKVYFSEPDSLNVCITFQVHYVYESCRIRKHMLLWCWKVMRIVSFLNLTKLLFLKTEFKRVNWRLSKYLIYPKEPLQLTLHIYICKVNKHNFRQAWKIGDVSETNNRFLHGQKWNEGITDKTLNISNMQIMFRLLCNG